MGEKMTTACALFVPLILFVLGNIEITLLITKGVPDLKRLLEEPDLEETTCRLISANETGIINCTYIENCGEHCKRERKSSFQCLQVSASYNYSNSSIVIAEMFRSHHDAVKTDFGCSAYECEDSSKIFEYFREVSEVKSFQCYYQHGKLEYVYFDPVNRPLVIFIFVLCILLILLGFVLIFVIEFWIIKYCPKIHVSWRKTTRNIGKFPYCYESNSQDNIPKSLKNGSYRKCKRLITKSNVNRELVIDRRCILKTQKYRYNLRPSMLLSPLAVATKYGHIKIMDYLVSIEANINYVYWTERKGIFHLACDSVNKDVIKWCIDNKLPINRIDSAYRTPLSTYLNNVL